MKRVLIKDKKKRKAGKYEPFYEPRFAKMAESHCRLGATNTNLADLFGVSTTAIENWLVKYKEFGEAVARGKSEVFDPLVERSLAELALGYAMDIEEAKITKDGDVVRYKIRKKFPPNVTACIFWLKNRQPEKWRDIQDHNVNLKKKELDKLTADELLQQIKKDASEIGILPNLSMKDRDKAN